ncbi:hypothetical protein IEQ34_012145 [Dendrobium chrysotoxum]|uniref:Uncharacterized protein n=1 Tax=Dendrobium chrysotoxum TaxID=161865 RepID=A0AAV7GRQ0_DENCH|nr:hypothetical protein IEQ34_012145 [Dendrobium chrysotoxum]
MIHTFVITFNLLYCKLGPMKDAKANALNKPLYAALMEEVKSIIEIKGSFHVDLAQTFESNLDFLKIQLIIFGKNVAKYLRAMLEPFLICPFGVDIIEDLFSDYAQNITRHFSAEKAKFVVLILALKSNE